jgi:branched-chain amino acid transport system ATP-binding protein
MTLLELDDINTKYGDSHVLHDVSLSVDDDEVVAVLGRNGAGKSTTLKSIMGIQSPFRGSIRYEGEELVGGEVHEIADRGIKYVPEDRRVFDTLTVREHLLMSADDDYRTGAEELERAYELFPKLGEMSNRQGKHLSGGEQQMLAIARALVGPTELLLLDEPSEGLAPQIVETIFHTIQRLSDETTILLVEQNYELARAVSDRYYILDQGRVVSEGPMAALEDNESLKAEYLGVAR